MKLKRRFTTYRRSKLLSSLCCSNKYQSSTSQNPAGVIIDKLLGLIMCAGVSTVWKNTITSLQQHRNKLSLESKVRGYAKDKQNYIVKTCSSYETRKARQLWDINCVWTEWISPNAPVFFCVGPRPFFGSRVNWTPTRFLLTFFLSASVWLSNVNLFYYTPVVIVYWTN